MDQEPSTRPTSQAMPDGLSAGHGETTQSVTDQAKDTAGQVVDQAKETAGQVAEQAKQQATSQLESQKERTVDMLVTVAQALRQTGQHLQEQEQTAVGGYVEQAAERLETVTNYLRTRDVPALLAETQDLARRKPGLFLSGALALGFIGARFLKSSGQRAMAQGGAGQRAMAQGGANGSYPPMLGYSTQRPAGTLSSYAGGNATPAPGASRYASLETPERAASDWKLGATGALEP